MNTQTATHKTTRITKILAHDVSYHSAGAEVGELDECTAEELERMINNEYTSGIMEATFEDAEDPDETTTITWHIIKWQDIALQLNNALTALEWTSTPERKAGRAAARKQAEEAQARFDKEWKF